MAKKRKGRSSEPESSSIIITPDDIQQPPLIEFEPQPQPQEEIIEEEPEEDQTIEEEEELTEQQQEDPQIMEAEYQQQQQQETEDDQEGDTVNTSNDAVSAAAATTTTQANGGGGGGEGEGEGEEKEEEEEEEEPVERLLEPFSKEQLLVLVKEAVSKYPQFVESVLHLADADPAHRKIFVHGLGWDTTSDTLTSEFRKYGEIEDCKAVSDKVSGKSKGYAFILFKDRSGAQKALRQPQKKIGNRMTSCQLASSGPIPAPPPTAPPMSEYTQRKIFVSNVSSELDPQKLLDFFSKYGEIEDGPLGLDKQTGKPKGFALFVYKTMDSARKALEEPHKNFEGHTLHCQRAIDGPKLNKPYYQQHHHQQPHQQFHHHSSKKSKYSSGGGGAGSGHLMAPSGPAMGFNPAVAPPALTPALGQALTALLATQGTGFGITNLLGELGAQVNQGMQPVMNNPGYVNQGGGSYGNQPGMQGGYHNLQMGQGTSRPQQGGASYMGHGHGH